MTQLVLTASGWLNAWQEGIQSFIKEVVVKHKARKLAKQTVNELSKLSNRELSDLGLCRADIRGIAEKHYQEEVNQNLRGWV